jgi:tetratricopeptide (TPR) repeat protein
MQDDLEAAKHTLSREITRLTADSETSGHCSLALARILLSEQRGEDAVNVAERALESIGDSRRPSEVPAALLGAAAYGYNLRNQRVRADQYFQRALKTYAQLGRERSNGALIVLNDWGAAALAAGMPRRALLFFEQHERIERERGPGIEPGTTVVGNRALALLNLGRFEQARAEFELECRLAIQRKDEYSYCIVSSCWLGGRWRPGSLTAAAEFLARAKAFLSASVPADHPTTRMHATLQGRLDLAQGRLADARAQFARVPTIEGSNRLTVNSLMAAGGDNFLVLPSGVDRVVGPVDLDALVQ